MTQQEIYLQGYIEKCAEYGVDGVALLKEAARGEQFIKAMQKLVGKGKGGVPLGSSGNSAADQLSHMKDLIGSVVTGANPSLGQQALSTAGKAMNSGTKEIASRWAEKALDARKALKYLAKNEQIGEQVSSLQSLFK